MTGRGTGVPSMNNRNPGLKLIAEMIRLLARDLPKFAVESRELDDVAEQLDVIAQRLETTSDLINPN
jgi:hypothetical protein